MNAEEKFEEIKRKINPETTLHIARVPRKTNKEFKGWANEEFEGDYGMALKHLWDFFKGCFPKPNEEVNQKIEVLAEEITNLKSQPVLTEEPKKKVIRSVGGTVIAEKKEE